MKKQILNLLRKLACGGEKSNKNQENGLEDTVLFKKDESFNLESMLRQSGQVMDNLRVQTQCYRAEIDALRSEIERLRNETRSSFSASISRDSGCSSQESVEESILTPWIPSFDLIESLDRISQTIPVFIDMPTTV
jgi:hypothetical protein